MCQVQNLKTVPDIIMNNMRETPRDHAVTSGCDFDRSVGPLLNNISNEKTERKKRNTPRGGAVNFV